MFHHGKCIFPEHSIPQEKCSSFGQQHLRYQQGRFRTWSGIKKEGERGHILAVSTWYCWHTDRGLFEGVYRSREAEWLLDLGCHCELMGPFFKGRIFFFLGIAVGRLRGDRWFFDLWLLTGMSDLLGPHMLVRLLISALICQFSWLSYGHGPSVVWHIFFFTFMICLTNANRDLIKETVR